MMIKLKINKKWFIGCMLLVFSWTLVLSQDSETSEKQTSEKQDSVKQDSEKQDSELTKITRFISKKRINAAYGLLGGHQLELNGLNEKISVWGYPYVKENHFTYGLGGHIILNKLVLGVELQRFFKKTQITTCEFNTYGEAHSINLNFGYLSYSKKGIMAYPLLGIGYGELRVHVTENNIQSFNDINVLQRTSLSIRKSIVMNIGLGCDYFFNYDTKKKGKNCFMIGFRTGYKLPLINNHWTVNGTAVTNGPESAFSGPYAHIAVGLGGWVEKLIKIAI